MGSNAEPSDSNLKLKRNVSKESPRRKEQIVSFQISGREIAMGHISHFSIFCEELSYLVEVSSKLVLVNKTFVFNSFGTEFLL